MEKLSILIIEDNPADALLIKEYLAEQNGFDFAASETNSLSSAMGLLTHYDYDVVLLDLSLPDSSGLDTVRRVIANYPEIAVIVLTGLQDEEVALRSVRYGAQDYLEKQTLSPLMLYKSIIYSIERKKALQEKDELLKDLTHALEKIESLEGILPLCVSCKRILGEDRQWLSIEEYIHHTNSGVAQLICPACREDLEIEESS